MNKMMNENEILLNYDLYGADVEVDDLDVTEE